MQHYEILAGASEAEVCALATKALRQRKSAEVTLVNGPQVGLVMVRVRESVADSQFNVGELLATEVQLEVDGQVGYAMVMGDAPRRALAVAVVDAVLRLGGATAVALTTHLDRLGATQLHERQRLFALAAQTNVAFETF